MARSLIACALRAVLVFLRATYVLSRSSSWQLAGSRIEGWHSIRITGDSGISLYGDVFGSTFTALQGAVPCTQVEVLGATYPAFMLPLAENSTSSTFSIVAAVSSSGGQPLSAGQSNGLLASLRGMDLTLSSSQGEAAAARTALPPSAWGNSSLPLSLGDASRTIAPSACSQPPPTPAVPAQVPSKSRSLRQQHPLGAEGQPRPSSRLPLASRHLPRLVRSSP